MNDKEILLIIKISNFKSALKKLMHWCDIINSNKQINIT